MDPIDRVRVRARDGDSEVEREDVLAVEEPLEIRIRAEGAGPISSFVTTMRTPGDDEELSAGLLFAEGVLENAGELRSLERPADPRIDAELKANILIATLAPEAYGRAVKLQRGTVMGSACGVCGKTSIENVIPSDRPPLADPIEAKATGGASSSSGPAVRSVPRPAPAARIDQARNATTTGPVKPVSPAGSTWRATTPPSAPADSKALPPESPEPPLVPADPPPLKSPPPATDDDGPELPPQ